MTQDEFINKLNVALKEGLIVPLEKKNAIRDFKGGKDSQILKLIEARGKAKKISNIHWAELSEKEALQRLVRQNDYLSKDIKSIKGWVTFMGILCVLSIILALIFSAGI